MTKILVTGNRGFVSKHVIAQLEGKYDLIGMDLPDYDFTDRGQMEEFFDMYKPEVVLHIGAMAGLKQCYEDPTSTYMVNVQGTAILLEQAAKRNCKFIYCSTWAVQGLLEHPYDLSKKAAEDLVLLYEKKYGLDACVLRMATMYGRNMRNVGVMPAFINSILNDNGVSVLGTGDQFRQFLNVKDAAVAFECALKYSKRGQIYNICGDEQIKIIDIARDIYYYLGKTPNIAYFDERVGDETPIERDNKKARLELKWKPKITYKKGLHELIDHFKAKNERQ